MNGRYRLDGHTPVPVDDLLEWATMVEGKLGSAEWRVARDDVGDAYVSTVFLGLDHNHYGEGPPLVFETMILGGAHAGYQERYATWEEAEAGHARAVALVRGAVQ